VSAIPDPNQELEWGEWEEETVRMNQQFFLNDFVATLDSIQPVKELAGFTIAGDDFAVIAYISVQGSMETYVMKPILLFNEGRPIPIPDTKTQIGLRMILTNIDPDTGNFTFNVSKTQKEYIVLKAIEKPMINILWIGTLVMVLGFIIAIRRRYREFMKMRTAA